MPPTNTFALYDKILDGRLRTLLTDWRADGLSYAQIARALHQLGVKANRSTVHRWCGELSIPGRTRP